MTRYTIEKPINLSFQRYIIHLYINFFKVDPFFEEILQDYNGTIILTGIITEGFFEVAIESWYEWDFNT